ncbi:MAG TPA: MucB/RseB C-terminal domain-containing protein [Burkholderiaceae bacterium]|nr:MucB/RseB C-terminal domain-containing protein [Burkholderiaceae bacterium]
MRTGTWVAAGWLMVILHTASWASDAPTAQQWLQKLQTAADKLEYTGVFVYQQGGAVQASRVVHVVEPDGAREKLEVLDGTPREVFRQGDETRCLMPDSRTVLVERGAQRDAFPALLQATPQKIAQYYDVKRVGSERVAGLDTDVLTLGPRDKMRFGYRLWVDRQTGLLVKAQTMDERSQIVEQIAFTELRIGGPIDRNALKPSWDTQGWRVEHASATTQALTRWSVNSAVPGFEKTREVKRAVAGQHDVGQFVFSDGLAAISVFIEPWREGKPVAEIVANRGSLNMLSRRHNEWLITVLGEAPMASIRAFAGAVEIRNPPSVKP